jgi:hypothetical protein
LVARLSAGEKSDKQTPAKKTIPSPIRVLDPNTWKRKKFY